MSWFRRLSIAKFASLNKNQKRTTSNNPALRVNRDHNKCSMQCRSREGSSPYNTGGTEAMPSTSRYIPPELVDPEEFFEDPYHVQMYRDEREFLDMISEWVIIEDPNRYKSDENFFSADFEAEFINVKRTTSKASVIEEDQFRIYEKSDPEHKNNNTISESNLTITSCISNTCDDDGAETDGDYKFFWGHWIKTGCIVNPFVAVEGNSSKIAGHCGRSSKARANRKKRRRNKSEALQHSIMSAIKDPVSPVMTNSNNCSSSGNHSKDGCEHDQRQDDVDHAESDDEEIDVEVLFGLDDNGNIILDINHIEEEKGYGFLMCRTKKLYRSIKKGEEVGENSLVGKRILGFLKELTKCLTILFLCGHPRNKSQYGGPEESIRDYTLQLANDHSSTFSRNIENFIACTKESREPAPQVVMRNMRQFMSGMKNYLVKHGEGEFHQEVQKARSQLKSDEFLNLDAILEAVMHQLVVLPLREHLYGLFVDYYTRSGDIQLLVQNVKYACARNAPEFGIRPCVAPPSPPALAQIGVLLVRLQEAELPLEKLELFLCVISSIFDATGCPRGQQLGADDFLPILVYVVAKCGFVGAEIEAEYMWGLLQPALLNGEAGYYLTALCSAVHVLKSFIGSDNEGTGSLDWRSSSLPACSSVLRVIIPDECNGSLQTRTLPVRPHTTTRDVCRIIAHKARITNPQDYGLFKLVDGEETLLVENECPQDARIAARGKHCMLAYKRLDAKIAWPTATSA